MNNMINLNSIVPGNGFNQQNGRSSHQGSMFGEYDQVGSMQMLQSQGAAITPNYAQQPVGDLRGPGGGYGGCPGMINNQQGFNNQIMMPQSEYQTANFNKNAAFLASPQSSLHQNQAGSPFTPQLPAQPTPAILFEQQQIGQTTFPQQMASIEQQNLPTHQIQSSMDVSNQQNQSPTENQLQTHLQQVFQQVDEQIQRSKNIDKQIQILDFQSMAMDGASANFGGGDVRNGVQFSSHVQRNIIPNNNQIYKNNQIQARNQLVNEALNFLHCSIQELSSNLMINIDIKRPILLALYQKLAILCFETENQEAVYPILNQLIYQGNQNLIQNQIQNDKTQIDFSQDLTLLLVLAQIEFKLGNSQKCNELCDAIISQDCANLQALEMKGDICKHFCQIDQAFFYYSKAIEQSAFSQRSGVSSALSNIGDLYKRQGKMREAIQHYESALFKEAHADSPQAVNSDQRIDLKSIRPNNQNQISKIYAETFMKLFNTKMACCDWSQYDEFNAHLKEIVLKQFMNGEMPCVDPFSLFMIDFSMDDKLLISTKWAENEKTKAIKKMKSDGIHYFEPFQHQLIDFDFDKENRQSFFKIRIGYVSSDFADHPLAHLLNSLFKLHDRADFQVVGFSLRQDDKSAWRENIKQSCDEFYQMDDGITALQLADFIKRKNIHILFNLNGWTQGARQDAFSLRPAPIQIQFMGFCGTTGADYIDYIVTDQIASPPKILDLYYSEKAIYMPNSYFLNDYKQSSLQVFDSVERRPKRSDYGLPEDKFIFANFNQFYKLDPMTFEVWMDILKAVPDSVLWILEYPIDAKQNLQNYAAANGVDPSRIIMTQRAGKQEHINRCFLADLALDNPVTNGHTTSCDLLWSGLPMITFPLTQNMPSRVAMSILAALGVGPQTICGSYTEYSNRAKSLALGTIQDLGSQEEREQFNQLPDYIKSGTKGSPELKLLRHQIEKNRLSAPLFDTETWAKHLEVGLREAFRLFSHENKKKANIFVQNIIENQTKRKTSQDFQGSDCIISNLDKIPLQNICQSVNSNLNQDLQY